MNFPKQYFLFFFLLAYSSILFAYPSSKNEFKPDFNRDEIKSRISELDLPFKTKYTTSVEGYLKGYLVLRPDRSEKIIGKEVMYFPMYEEKLKSNNLPEEIKYLSIVESALNEKALSRVGAGGLWQFMPETGAHYGLTINEYVDERFDAEKATDAAIKYLQKQYDRFGDWALALAAYNSGPGRVRRAMKRARSKNFWRLQRFLPRETRNYVPAFIAAAYLSQFHELHELKRELPPLDLQLTERTTIHRSLSFVTIAQVTGLSMEVIRTLNPAYIKDFIPESIKGYSLTLPSRVMLALKDYLALEQLDSRYIAHLSKARVLASPVEDAEQNHYYKSVYSVNENELLSELSEVFNLPSQKLQYWNNIWVDSLITGQELTFYKPVDYVRFILPDFQELPEILPLAMNTIGSAPGFIRMHTESKDLEKNETPTSFSYYVLKRKESILDVQKKFIGNTLEDILKLNGLSEDNPPTPGMKLKLRKF